MTLTNLTEHALNVGGLQIPPSGALCRVTVGRTYLGPIETAAGSVLAFRPTCGDLVGLPAPQADTIFLVSLQCRLHPSAAQRSDVASPGKLIRDGGGNVVGCDGLDFN